MNIVERHRSFPSLVGTQSSHASKFLCSSMSDSHSADWSEVTNDAYGGIIFKVNTGQLFSSGEAQAESRACQDVFLAHMRQLIQTWCATGVRGVWLHVTGSHESKRLLVASWVASCGFSMHRVSATEVVLCTWLAEREPNVLPRACTHIVGKFHEVSPANGTKFTSCICSCLRLGCFSR